MSNALLTTEQSASLLTFLDWAIPVMLDELKDGAPIVCEDVQEDLDLTEQLINISQMLRGKNAPRSEEGNWREALASLNADYLENLFGQWL